MNKKIKFRFENNQSNDSSYENKQIKWSSLNKTAKTNGQLFFISDIDKLEMDIQKFAYVIDKKIVESEKNALTFLSNNPERIPWYIKKLKEQYENWKSSSK